jgi:Family of unknown function (DUF6325)
MTYGPIELLVVGFPGNKFTGEIAPALGELVDTGLINIIDILFVHKDADGVVNALELADLDEDTWAVFDPLVSEIAGLLNQDDAQRLCESLPVNSSAGILLTALQNANAKLILNERIPRAVIDEMLAQAEQAEEVA